MTDHADPTPEAALIPVVRAGTPGLPDVVQGPLDVALGAAVVAARPVVGLGITLGRALEPLARDTVALMARPPLVPVAWTPADIVSRLASRGRTVRLAGTEDVQVAGADALDVVIPTVLVRVLDRIDITELVLQRVDLERIVDAVLARMDLTEVVLTKVDLGRVVTAALDAIDLNDIVRTRVDLADIAEEVIDDVNLPEIIRDSTTGVAAEVVDGTRLRAVQGDEMVNKLVDRILLRRKARRTAAPEGSLDDDQLVFAARADDDREPDDTAGEPDESSSPSVSEEIRDV